MEESVLTHAAFLPLWSFWASETHGPRGTCGDTRDITQVPCTPSPGNSSGALWSPWAQGHQLY